MVVLSVLLLLSAIDPFSPANRPFVRGDANRDGVVGVADIVFLRKVLSEGDLSQLSYPDSADVNDDGKVTWEDYYALKAGLFRKTGPCIKPPYPIPKLDPTPDDLVGREDELYFPDLPYVNLHREEPDPWGGSDLQYIHFAKRTNFAKPGSVVRIPLKLELWWATEAVSFGLPVPFEGLKVVGYEPSELMRELAAEEPWVYVTDKMLAVAILFQRRAEAERPVPFGKLPLGDVLIQVSEDVPEDSVFEFHFRDLGIPSMPDIIWIDNEIGDYEGKRYILQERYAPYRLIVSSRTPFTRGDANGDGWLSPDDVFMMLRYLFGELEELPCPDAADVNDDGVINLADPARLLIYFYCQPCSHRLPKPFPNPGFDETVDDLPPCDYP